MNLDRARDLLAKLPVKDRELNTSVPFILNPNQAKAHLKLKKAYEETKQLRTIILKSRRVGMSSYIDGLAFCHCNARPQAHAEIVAHLKEVSQKGLFRVPRDLAIELNKKTNHIDVRANQIRFMHSTGESVLDIATAGSVGGGRGLTLTFLHLSECAQYPGADSFLSILPAVSKAPDTVIALESTAFGRSGLGQTFYDFWVRSNRPGSKWSGYTPIFLSWLDDPACVRNEEEAYDAPASDLERELMGKPFNCTRAQIAWMRMVLEGECDGSESKFSQEYPWTPEVAFIATGDPAFTPMEINYAVSTKRDPVYRGHLVRSGNNVVFEDDRRSKLLLWEQPQPKCHYYIGVDCARGIESGDFSAYVILNGTTGNVAARFADLVDPPRIADEVSKLGRWFNSAMVIVELTGNLGLWCNAQLRDKYNYPNLYIWKGKDDKAAGSSKSKSQGWETTSRTRDLMFSTFRGKVRDGKKGIPGGLTINDEEIIRQMDLATVGQGLRWEVEYGHDDILMAVLLATVACAQYPPPNILNFIGNTQSRDRSQGPIGKLKPQSNLQDVLKQDLSMIIRPEPKRCRNTLGWV